jgi:hypothetical protein
MKVNRLENLEIYQLGFEIESIGNRAIQATIKENKEKGIPTVFSINGTIFYELPEGDLTTESPFDDLIQL